MKAHEFILLTVVVFVGSFAALLVWAVIVKGQVQQTLASNPTASTITSLLGQL